MAKSYHINLDLLEEFYLSSKIKGQASIPQNINVYHELGSTVSLTLTVRVRNERFSAQNILHVKQSPSDLKGYTQLYHSKIPSTYDQLLRVFLFNSALSNAIFSATIYNDISFSHPFIQGIKCNPNLPPSHYPFSSPRHYHF